MNGVIPLDEVLRDATRQAYRDLVTRPTGAAVRHRLVSALRDLERTEALLDFSRIGLVDYSCADEVVAKLVAVLHELPVSRVVLGGVREDQAEAIEHALIRHGLAVLALEDSSNRPMLLGAVDDDCRQVFSVLVTVVRATAGPIADRLEWPEPRAHEALESLAAGRCILAHSDATYELGVLA
ncbi:MAG TPA: hypothetical protein PLL69_02870 [Gemmatimonadales bacterium]|nr:hypothetical protein [Gemmatimonadales bacterium]